MKKSTSFDAAFFHALLRLACAGIAVYEWQAYSPYRANRIGKSDFDWKGLLGNGKQCV